MLRQPDPEASQAAVWAHLSTDSGLRYRAFREARGTWRGRDGRTCYHRWCCLHHVWSVRLRANSASQNSRQCGRWRRLRKPSLRRPGDAQRRMEDVLKASPATTGGRYLSPHWTDSLFAAVKCITQSVTQP